MPHGSLSPVLAERSYRRVERRILEIHKKHPDETAKGLAKRGEREILSWLAEAKETDSQMLEQMIQTTAGMGDAQVSAILMDARHRKLGTQAEDKPKPRSRTFEL